MVSDAVITALAQATLEQIARLPVFATVIGDHAYIANQGQITHHVAGFGERLAALLIQQSGLRVLPSLEADVTAEMGRTPIPERRSGLGRSLRSGRDVAWLGHSRPAATRVLRAQPALWRLASWRSVGRLQALA